MAFIKHIAIASKDPAGTAEFYKQHFDLKELYRRPRDTGDDGVWLSDGYIYFAILKHGGSDAPKLGAEQSSDFCGIHHIGFMVDDQRATVTELEAANVPHVKGYRTRDGLVRPGPHRMRSSSGRTGCISTFVKKAGTRPSGPTPSSMN